MLDQPQLEALLGRSLTPNEVSNLSLYINIANQTVEQLLCTPLNKVTETRKFALTDGYQTVFTDIFTSVSSVEVNGDTLASSEYEAYQWDSANGSWYNSIVLDNPRSGSITVTAEWGFSSTSLPVDLQLLTAQAFAQVTTSNKAQQLAGVKSKSVEDFSISYATDISQNDEFVKNNSSTIGKYSLCNISRLTTVGCYHGVGCHCERV